MKNERFEQWLHKIFHTQDEEISCSECFDRVAHFVDVELAGKDAAGEMPEVKQHLEQCPACREEYETLRDLQRLENEGGALSSDDYADLIR